MAAYLIGLDTMSSPPTPGDHDVRRMRPCRLLRRIAKPPCHEAFSRHSPPDHRRIRPARRLVLVLHRRGDARPHRARYPTQRPDPPLLLTRALQHPVTGRSAGAAVARPPRDRAFADVRERRQAVAAGRATSADDHQFMCFVPLQLFNRDNRYNTMIGVMFGLGSLLAVWTTVIWLPTILSLMAQKGGIDAIAAAPFVGRGMMLWSGGGFFGYIVFGFLADLIGRRPTVSLFSLGTVAAGLTLYLALPAYEPWYPVVLPIFGFF